MTISNADPDTIIGQTLYGGDGDKIGTVGQVYLDDETGRPEWVTVSTGLFGTKESFVPVAQADLSGDGLRVPFDKDLVKEAPRVDAEQGHLSREEEAELYRHYNLEYAGGRQGLARDQLSDRDGAVGRDTSGPTTDTAMTRSEERLHVGTEQREAGRARLRKHVVTEQQQVTVPVTREEVRLEREPITEANRDAATSGPEISEEVHELTLHEERPVVDKEAVPVERVRLGTKEVTDEVQVSEEIRKEEIETDGIEGATPR
jgi:uncharacterized protein (TIGR02271 family)